MASLHHDPRTGIFTIRFRLFGRQVHRSLSTREDRDALAVKGRIEETILLIERGRLVIPDGADPILFVMTDGKVTSKPTAPPTVAEVIEQYQADLPQHAKAASTLYTERIHVAHLQRLIGRGKLFASITPAVVQKYIADRSQESYRGRKVAVDTIEKELATLRYIWRWAVRHKIAAGENPCLGAVYPLRAEKQPFRSWSEIEAIVKRGLTEDQEADLWECLFLSVEEIGQLLAHVAAVAKHPFILPMFALIAWTGMRRSEMLRAQIEDVDLATNVLVIRETKRVRGRSGSFRYVPIHEKLREVLAPWLAAHPGGHHLICKGAIAKGRKGKGLAPAALSTSEAVDHFKRTLGEPISGEEKSKWVKVGGFHVFRHSFASNLAAAGVKESTIDRWMGHQTVEMRRRYQHLFPGDAGRSIASLTPAAINEALGK